MSTSPVVARRTGAIAVLVLSLALGLLGVAIPSQPAAAVQVVGGGFTTSASTSPTTVAAGSPVSLTITVSASQTRRALVDLEIYDAAGRKAYQRYWDNQSFTAGAARQLTASWTPAAGTTRTYTAKIGVFSVGWGSMYHWNNQAATFRVTTGTTSTTTQPPATTKPPATTTTTKPPTTSTTTTSTTTTTKPPTTTTTTTTTTTPPGTTPSGHFTTLPVGAALPSGAECAGRVRAAVEIRPENAAPNANKGTRANANTRTDWSGWTRVDGAFSGTTDQIIQWAACKWGIDEDIVRAQVIKESYWYMSTNGDGGDSWGLGQVRKTAHPSAFQYSVNAQTSSAYNLDYTYASWRACFEGVYTWLNNTNERNGTYGPGDVWGCVGVWFSGRWYWNNDAYLNQTGDSVHWHYNNKTWLTSTFING